MKKISLLLVLIFICSFTISCGLNNKDYHANYENKIMPKDECIKELKDLFQVTEIWLFDCDFSNLKNISITDISYNTSVLANMKYNEEKARYVIDFDSQALVCLVANYKINYNGTSFGFSVYYDILEPGTKSYKNDQLVSETRNILFDKNTFNSIKDLQPQNGDGVIYQSNNTIDKIKVPEGFYPNDLKNCINPIIMFSQYSGDLYNIKIEHIPIHIVTHYASYEDFNKDKSGTSIMKIVVDYMMDNAEYVGY